MVEFIHSIPQIVLLKLLSQFRACSQFEHTHAGLDIRIIRFAKALDLLYNELADLG